MHDSWRGSVRRGHDIALIELDRRADFALPDVDFQGTRLESGQRLTATGWGRTHSRSTADVLQMAESLLYVPHDQCREYHGNDLRRHMICAGFLDQDTCTGTVSLPEGIQHHKQVCNRRFRGTVDGSRCASWQYHCRQSELRPRHWHHLCRRRGLRRLSSWTLHQSERLFGLDHERPRRHHSSNAHHLYGSSVHSMNLRRVQVRGPPFCLQIQKCSSESAQTTVSKIQTAPSMTLKPILPPGVG